MSRSIARMLLLASLVLASSDALAEPRVYEVSATIKQGGESVASPVLRVKPMTVAKVSVAGDNGYRMSVTVAPSESNAVDLSLSVGTAKASVETEVSTILGKPMVVSSGDIEISVIVTGDGG